MNTTVRRRSVGVAALGIGAALALAAPATVAVGQESPPLVAAVDVESPAVLVARGAAITVPVDVVCSPGAMGDVWVEVSERVGSAIAFGYGSESFTCTGGNQSIDLLVTASGAKSFKKGEAVVRASMQAYSDFGWASATDTATIDIEKG